MSRTSKARRKKGVDFRKTKSTVVQDSTQTTSAVPIGDIYLGVVATFGFDPILEAEERRRLS